ncbi:hypothetical protein BD779DRAFT_1714897 [Infundibulicybe gibba]|nr:hypothetical protein BD779DRAFT_1714897 [Infundibulicybe gibba]
MTSLATQLAQSASLNRSLLVDRSRRKAGESYLFTGKEADIHDLESIYALGVNGLLQLSTLNPSLRQYHQPLFSDQAKTTDRTLISVDENNELNKAIEGFLFMLGPYLMEAPTGKVLEWLVRRFRINEFNVESLLCLFLPYHESPHFAKMVTILHINCWDRRNSKWSFLLAYKSAAQSVPRAALVKEMLRSSDIARFVTSLLPDAMKGGYSHRTLLAFNAASLHDYLLRLKSLDEGIAAFILPALLVPLENDPIRMPFYILLSTLSQKIRMAPVALKALVGVMAGCAQHVSTKQFISAVTSVCTSQNVLDGLSTTAVKAIVRLDNIDKELTDACGWAGIDAFLRPLSRAICRRLNDEVSLSLLETLISAPNVPLVVIGEISTRLLSQSGSVDASETLVPIHRLLSVIQQRFSSTLHQAADALWKADENLKEPLMQLIISLTMAQSPTMLEGKDVDMIIASASADANVRATAVKSLVASISDEGSAGSKELESIRAALLARILDTDLITPSTVASRALNALTPKPSKSILRTHLSMDKSFWSQVFYQILAPFLLYSKPRQRTADLVWDVITSSFDSGDEYELLKGCIAIVKSAKEKDSQDVMEKMSETNTAVASLIAGWFFIVCLGFGCELSIFLGNILSSSNTTLHITNILDGLTGTDPHPRSFYYLILRALLSQSSGKRQIGIAHRVLATLKLESLPEIDDSLGGDQLLEVSNFLWKSNKSVVAKPASKNTLHLLQLSIISSLLSIPSPVGVSPDWFSNTSTPSKEPSCSYVQLMRQLYMLANSPATPLALASYMNKILFTRLGSGLWVQRESAGSSGDFATTALSHAMAFLKAHTGDQAGVDFQTILPALLVAVHESSPAVQETAKVQFSTVYSFDAIYGDSGGQLQYLDQEDFRRYLNALTGFETHIVHDGNYLSIFHHEHLSISKTDSKRGSEYKRRILCYLLSHISALPLLHVQLALLKCVENVQERTKAGVLLPVMQRLLKDGAYDAQDPQLDELAVLLISSFDPSTANDLNDAKNALWGTLTSLISHFLPSGRKAPFSSSGNYPDTERRSLRALNFERKIELCQLVLQIGSQDAMTYPHCKNLLSNLVSEVNLIVHLLGGLEPVNTDGPRATIGTRALPGSLELISHLLDTLHSVIQSVSSTHADVSYIEQLLMSAVESAANHIQDVSNLAPNTIRLDILVELIRVADNPQTFHQALLLMSSLTRLAPESVLQNVMPVFTFMGSNVFHRDDTYSFSVVRQVFLRVFTDAANHIPRHRRTSFFSHLIDVMGPHDFAAPVCMLLLEKAANRIVRQNDDEIQATLALPMSILQHYSPTIQIKVLAELLRESYRLASKILTPGSAQLAFLDGHIDDDHSSTLVTTLRRRAQSLVLFVGYALKASSTNVSSLASESMGELVSALISLATLKGGSTTETKIGEIVKTTHTAMAQAMKIMSVSDLIGSVLQMLESDDNTASTLAPFGVPRLTVDEQVISGALDLLANRLGDVTTNTRKEITPSIIKILGSIQRILVLKTPEFLVLSAYQALKSISATLSPGEEALAISIIPTLIDAIQKKAQAQPAVATLAPLCSRLGPRVIPHFRVIVQEAVTVIRDGNGPAVGDSFNVLHGLLTSIPAFWGTGEIAQVVTLYVDHSSPAPSPAMSTLIKKLVKYAPNKTLLSTVIGLWPELGATRAAGYFDVLGRILRSAVRSTVLEQLRPSFNVFLEAFESVGIIDADGLAESRLASAFKELVVKLNEAAFRPLFRRLYDWAFASESDASERKITFCNVFNLLLDYFKGLMNPYMSLLLAPSLAILGSPDPTAGGSEVPPLWICVIKMLTKSLAFDDGAFWRDDKLRQLQAPLIAQIPRCASWPGTSTGAPDARGLLQECIGALAESTADDALLKSLNLALLMHTRADDARLRIYALACVETLWRAHGGKLLGFVAETATFIAECSEDENDLVVQACLQLKDAVESVAGNIAGCSTDANI